MSDRERETARDFQHWVILARNMVHDSFTGDEKELQRLTMHAAQGMMLDHRLTEIESRLQDLQDTLRQQR